MASKTTTFTPTGLPDGELWSNPANWSNGIPVDGDSVIVSEFGFTNGTYDDIPALSLATLTEQQGTIVNVTGSKLTVGTLAGRQGLLDIKADALDAGAPVTVTVGAVSAGSGALSALGVGAMLIYQAAADQGEAFQAEEGGTIVIDAVPSSTAEYIYNAEPNETLAFKSPAATNAGAIINVAPSEVLEVPGTSVSAVIFGTNSLSVTTSAGTYAFTNVTYAAAVRGYTAAMDSATGLVAITFNDVNSFQRNVKATSGRLSGDYLWSNAANWTSGLPANGGGFSVGVAGTDDTAALRLSYLTLDKAGAEPEIFVTGSSLAITDLEETGTSGTALLEADATDAGAPVSVTVVQNDSHGVMFEANGAGADLLDESAAGSAKATEYAVAKGGVVELSDTPLATDIFTYMSSGTFAFKKPAAVNPALFQSVGAGSTIEVPGGAVLGVTIGTNSVTIGTDLGTYAFTSVFFAAPVTNYTISVDSSTVLQAVTFRGADTFNPNPDQTDLARFLWSNAANWTEGVPVNGDSVLTNYYGIDDIQNLTLSGLTLSSVNNVVVEHSLTIGTLTEGTNTLVGALSDSPAAPAILTIGTIVGAPYDNVIEAQGAGATVIDRSATDLAGQSVAGLPGMQYEVNAGGTLEFLSAAPAAISQFVFLDTKGKGAGGEGTIAFGAPGATVAAALSNVAPGDVLELPGTSVSNVVFGTNSLTVTTDAGTVAFTNVTYGDPVAGYTSARDPATGLVAITFTGMDVFEPNVMATSGIFAGQYLWSNAANWSDGVPISGDIVQISTSGISDDDVPNLSLAALQLGFSLPSGVSETIDGVSVVGNNLTIGTLEATPGQNHPGGLLTALGDQGVPGGGPATVTVDAGGGGDMVLEAAGIGAHVIDKTTQEAGVENVRAYEISDANKTETYEPLLANDTVDLLGPLILGATKPGETIAFHDPGASNPGLLENVAAGDTVEVPGTVALSVTIGTTSLTVTTDAGSYDFSNVTYSSAYPIGNYTASVDGATGLVAITFGPPNMFEQNVAATSGPLSGDYLWSNAANWSEGVPVDGDSVVTSLTGFDDIAALSLSTLTLNTNGYVVVTGSQLTVGTVAVDAGGVLEADAGILSAPVSVTVGAVVGSGGILQADESGATLVDQSATDPGEKYNVFDGGEIELLSAVLSNASQLNYHQFSNYAGPLGTIALGKPAATNTAALAGVRPRDVLELPGTSVSAVTFGADSLSITTDAGTYAFSDVTYSSPVTGYTAAPDAATGLLAITLTHANGFVPNVAASSGTLAGDFLWSNADNWSSGSPADGDSVSLGPGVVAYDDVASLDLSRLTLSDNAEVTVTGGTLTVATVQGSADVTVLLADAMSNTPPVVVTVDTITGVGGEYGAKGAGATFDDVSLTDPGETYIAEDGGLVDLLAAPSDRSTLIYSGPGTFALRGAGATNAVAITGIASGDVLELPGSTVSNVTFGTSSLIVTTDAGTYDFTKVSYQGGVIPAFYSTATDGATGLAAVTVNCFREGTRIATGSGEAAVERLRIGDLVRVVSGALRPIRWIATRQVDADRHPKPAAVLPVRIRRDAFGPGAPHRDLFISPDHAVYVEGVLIPVKYLINGGSIRQVKVSGTIRYFHIELDRHDVLFAEGLQVESYLETGDRGMYHHGLAPTSPHPDRVPLVWDAQGYAPLVVVGPELDAAQRSLAAAG